MDYIDLCDEMISSFEKLSLKDMDESASIFKLPPKILTLVLKSPVLSRQDLLPCLIVCKRWHTVAKALLYDHISITEDINTELFLFRFRNYDLGRLVTKLTIIDRTKRKKISPLYRSYFMENALLCCQNIVEIRVTQIRPFYLLRFLSKITFPHLEIIDICWWTCYMTPCVKRWFYTANYHHKATIKYLILPDHYPEEIEIYCGDTALYISELDFLVAFDRLESVEYF